MAKVICNLPNASELISGVKFAAYKLGVMISEDIADDVAAEFVKIEGYALAEVEKAASSGRKAQAPVKADGATQSAPPAEAGADAGKK